MRDKRKRVICAIGACALVAWSQGAQAKTTYRLIHSFSSTDGANPVADLSLDSAGNMYGTTQLGGKHNLGSVFKIAPNGKTKVLHSFAGKKDGEYPVGGVTIISQTGDLYGTTKEGGRKNFGTLWRIAPDGTFSTAVIFNFKNGAYPMGTLASDGGGILYGITEDGGKGGFGTVFEFNTGGTFRVLYGFTGHDDGGNPVGGLIADSAGNLFGTTQAGGINDNGTVFVVNGDGEKVLYRFTGGNDGAAPSGALVRDSTGLLYGTAYVGGAGGYGTVFAVGTDGSFQTVHPFTGGDDGANPQGKLLEVGDRLYGTTVKGGGACNCGTVYSVSTGGSEKILHSFADAPADGANPYAGLAKGPNQLLFGTTALGGVDADGTVFKIGE